MKQVLPLVVKENNDIFSLEHNFWKRKRDPSLDFKYKPASWGIYGIHPYPAMLHFLVVRHFIEKYSQPNQVVLDPFLGSGVVAGECLISNRNFIGFDINPLAVLISKVRTTPLKVSFLLNELENIYKNFKKQLPQDIDFPNIDYWFDKITIKNLSRLKKAIFLIKNNKIKNFFKLAFSETVRRVSKTEYNEFKLLKKKEEKIFDVWQTFQKVSLKNIGLLSEFYKENLPTKANLLIKEKDILKGLNEVDYVDLVLTSPPYGDSRTTVAYGQFSRLPLYWLGYKEEVDKNCLGAKIKEINQQLSSDILYEILEEIRKKDEKRAKEVFSFYDDLYASIKVISQKVKTGGFVCFIVGNRRVKGVELPTDKICADFFIAEGFSHIETLVRIISNKRMPKENSPSNIKGDKASTMGYEYIVVLKKL